MTVSSFAHDIYAPRSWQEIVYGIDKKTGKPTERVVRKSAAAEWVKWPQRHEVASVVYQPGAPRNLPNELNMWQGWGVEEKYIKKGDISLWQKFLDYYFFECPSADREWVECWLAYPLQHPGAKLYTAIIAHSAANGTGKSLLGHTMARIYGEKNYSEINEKKLRSEFNEWAHNKQFIMAEEISGSDNKRDIRETAEYLKATITQPNVSINVKYQPVYTVRDCMNFYFTSNHPDGFYLEDTDRRFYVHELRCRPLIEVDPKFVKAYDAWYKTPEAAGALFYYFLNFDLGSFNPKAPARSTASKKSMIEAGRTDLAAWAVQLRDAPDQALRSIHGEARSAVVPKNTYQLMTSEELYSFWLLSGDIKTPRAKVMAELHKHLHRVNAGEPIWSKTKNTAIRLWAVQGNRKELDKLKEYDKRVAYNNKARKLLETLSPGQLAAIYDGERKTL